MKHEQIIQIANAILNKINDRADLLDGHDGMYGEEWELVYDAVYDVLRAEFAE